MAFVPDSVPPEQWARILEDMPWLEIPSSPLLAVAGVGQTTEAEGVTVELLAIEIRQGGAVIHWRARAAREVALLMPDVTVADDRSTSYRVAPAQGGGAGCNWYGETMFLPEPPTDATLIIEVLSFGPSVGMPPMPGYAPLPPVTGPWGFQVSLSSI
jgi:hypothetical protein